MEYRNLTLVCLTPENSQNFTGRNILIQFLDGTWKLGKTNNFGWTDRFLNNHYYEIY